jgi:hypothetical protein
VVVWLTGALDLGASGVDDGLVFGVRGWVASVECIVECSAKSFAGALVDGLVRVGRSMGGM